MNVRQDIDIFVFFPKASMVATEGYRNLVSITRKANRIMACLFWPCFEITNVEHQILSPQTRLKQDLAVKC